MEYEKTILDPCCGSRMIWFDRSCPMAVFGDNRSERHLVTDRSHGNKEGTRSIIISPDLNMDFRALPFSDGSFRREAWVDRTISQAQL